MCCCCFFFFKQKTAYEMRISDGVQTCALPISVSGGSFLSNATYGGQSPTRQNVVTGALAPAQYSIFQLVDFTSQTGTVTSDRKSTRLNSSHSCASRMPSSA